MKKLARALSTIVLVLAVGGTQAHATQPMPASNPERVVVFKTGVNAAHRATKLGVHPHFVYRYAISGFAAALTPQQFAKLSADRDVLMITMADRDVAMLHHTTPPGATPIEITPQAVPLGLQRIGAPASRTARINGRDDPMNVDVAVIDTGIQVDQPDLNVKGGADCSSGAGFGDDDGHGTLVAGLIGARDNAFGTVGVAPGARLWSVRVFDANGYGNDASILCGIDWVAQHKHTIEVTNLSVEDIGSDDANCGLVDHDPVHLALCNSVNAGMTYVAAAGNDSLGASGFIPAAFPQVITASGMADTDGRPGGLGPASCEDDADDAFSWYSNFGAEIDIAAPADCVESTYIGSQLAVNSGTSLAAPMVTGAVALIKARHPYLSPEGVKAMILAAREQTHLPGDPDGIDEGVLNVAGF